MSRKNENVRFKCEHCGYKIYPLTNGSYRNHCPACLYSKHVDNKIGDRASTCEGLMKPMSIKHGKKGYQIIHKCIICGKLKVNKITTNTKQPDFLEKIIELMSSDTP